LPIVVEAVERSPPLKVRSEEVALLINGYPNVEKPSDDVEVSVYPPRAFPTRILPNDGDVERPVPPYATERVDVAETSPLIAWRGPFSEEFSVSPFVPDTVRAVVEAYGKMEATDEVAVNEPARALFPRSELPLTERVLQGEVVPSPRFPF